MCRGPAGKESGSAHGPKLAPPCDTDYRTSGAPSNDPVTHPMPSASGTSSGTEDGWTRYSKTFSKRTVELRQRIAAGMYGRSVAPV
ncbi:hypothetical protein GCM10017772_41220 [Promicromonospora soli]|uniref:Uncharacterized protein n=1 Tax=Promicromonospora soli TaxID=2035533 RepID=A0A919G6N6_9MICO|nr:hypothetical protein GCM10017772_41220 [Promicromonospora soli]